MSTELATQIPINVVGSSKFGVWPKISLEKTYSNNKVIMSDIIYFHQLFRKTCFFGNVW